MFKHVRAYALLLVVSVAACITYNYVTQLEFPNAERRFGFHSQILEGTAASPYNYRVLVPWATEALTRAISATTPVSETSAWQFAYVAYDLVALSLFLYTLFVLLCRFHPPPLALAGVFFCAALLPISLRNHYYQPWSLIEAWFFCWALLLSHRGRFGILLALTAVAALNRWSAALIPVIYLLGALEPDWLRQRQFQRIGGVLWRFGALAAVAVATLFAVRRFQGAQDPIHTVQELWQHNTSAESLVVGTLHWLLFLGAGWGLALWGARRADPFLRRQLLFVPLYLLPVLLYGVWVEVRLLMPTYPLLVALLLYPVAARFAVTAEGGDAPDR